MRNTQATRNPTEQKKTTVAVASEDTGIVPSSEN